MDSRGKAVLRARELGLLPYPAPGVYDRVHVFRDPATGKLVELTHDQWQTLALVPHHPTPQEIADQLPGNTTDEGVKRRLGVVRKVLEVEQLGQGGAPGPRTRVAPVPRTR